MNRKSLFIVTALIAITVISFTSHAQGTWTQKNDIGAAQQNTGQARSHAVGFSIGDKGYVGLGTGYWTSFDDFWEYDPELDTWTQKSAFPGGERSGAVGFSIGDKGYVGTGSETSDFWEFDPATNQWTQKSAFPGGERYFAVGFSIGDKGYVGTGQLSSYTSYSGYKRDFWEYNPVTDTWLQIADCGNSNRGGAVGFCIDDKGYVGFGVDGWGGKNDFWEYNPASDVWTLKVGLGTKYGAVGFSIGNKGYVGTGQEEQDHTNTDYYNSFYEYNPDNNLWTIKANVPGNGRSFAYGFSIGSYAYLGGGKYAWGNHNVKNDLLYDFWAYEPGGNTWSKRNSFVLGRSGAAGFSIGNKGYVMGGSPGGSTLYLNDLWEYDPELNTWTQKASLEPGRWQAVAFAIGNFGYLGGGYGFNGNYKNFQVFYQYDPVNNLWTSKADMGGSSRRSAVGFSIGLKGYVGTGYDNGNNYKKDFWEYDPALNTWTQKADFAGGKREGAVGFSIANKGYVGTGHEDGYKKDFWEYDLVENTWSQKAEFGGEARAFAVGFSMGGRGYLGTGNNDGTYYNDFWEYDPDSDTWTQKSDFGGTARYDAVGLSINNKAYVGAGFDGIANQDFWEYNPDCSGWTLYADVDGDNYGDPSNIFFAEDCVAPDGYVFDNTDCDDSSITTHPGANEICNNLDDNCNGAIDDGLLTTYFADVDGDTYGDANTSMSSCVAVSGYVTDNTDCDDNNITINPSATESCNNLDDNCSGSIDEGLLTTYYADADGDSYGDPNNPVSSCAPVSGYVTNNTDCDDNNAAINPSATEICNYIDDNCDGNIDEGLQTIYYADVDEDSYGDANNSTSSCIPVNGYVTDNTDCNDNNEFINPLATETCNNLDDNCNGSIDDGLIFTTYYADNDGDNYGDPENSEDACAPISNFVLDNTDCDDSNPNVNPAATEITNNNIDDDCDGYVDEFGVGVSSINTNANQLSVFPNPTDGKFVIELELSDGITGEATIEVINMLGQVMQSQKGAIVKGKLQEEIQFSNEEAEGMYLVKVTIENKVFTAQINYQK